MNTVRGKRLEILVGPDRAAKAIDVLEIAEEFRATDHSTDTPDGPPTVGSGPDDTTLRRALIALADPPVFVACCTELLDDGHVVGVPQSPSLESAVEVGPNTTGSIHSPTSTAPAERTVRFANVLILAANRPRDAAPARLLAALALGRLGDSVGAAAEVDLGLAALPTFPPLIDVAAHNAFDRGDPTLAARLWRLLDPPHHNTEFAESVHAAVTPKLGRNDPCWCGSGRKFKACHLGQAMPLAARIQIEWLERKLLGWFLMRGPSAKAALSALAAQAAIGDPASAEFAPLRDPTGSGGSGSTDETSDPREPSVHDEPNVHDEPSPADEPSAPSDDLLHDPFFLGLLMYERKWLETFLHERRGLLSAHEASLLDEWSLSERTVYEVATENGVTGHDATGHGATGNDRNTIDSNTAEVDDRHRNLVRSSAASAASSGPSGPPTSSGPSLTLRLWTGDGRSLGSLTDVQTTAVHGSEFVVVGPSPTLFSLLDGGQLSKGTLLCGRVARNGAGGHALVGGAFIVAVVDVSNEPAGSKPGSTNPSGPTVADVQRACQDRDADALAQYRRTSITSKIGK